MQLMKELHVEETKPSHDVLQRIFSLDYVVRLSQFGLILIVPFKLFQIISEFKFSRKLIVMLVTIYRVVPTAVLYLMFGFYYFSIVGMVYVAEANQDNLIYQYFPSKIL
jgi:hypothetical protein